MESWKAAPKIITGWTREKKTTSKADWTVRIRVHFVTLIIPVIGSSLLLRGKKMWRGSKLLKRLPKDEWRAILEI